MKTSSHFDSAKAVIAFFIVLVGFAFFIHFYSYSDKLVEEGTIYTYITLVTIGLGLLIGLFYLVSNSQHQHKAVTHKSSAKKSKKRRK